MVGQPADAEDLAQEAFLRAYLSLASYDSSYRFSTWLFRIATNLAINRIKAASKIVSLEEMRERREERDEPPPELADPCTDSRPDLAAERAEMVRAGPEVLAGAARRLSGRGGAAAYRRAVVQRDFGQHRPAAQHGAHPAAPGPRAAGRMPGSAPAQGGTAMIVVAYAIALLLPLGFLYLIRIQDLYGQGQFKHVLLSFVWGLVAFGLAYGANSLRRRGHGRRQRRRDDAAHHRRPDRGRDPQVADPDRPGAADDLFRRRRHLWLCRRHRLLHPGEYPVPVAGVERLGRGAGAGPGAFPPA